MAGWLESLGNIFSSDDDDLEAAEPEKKTNHLSHIPYFDRPMHSDPSDQIIGENDAGQFVYKTIAGTTYTVGINPDQRNQQEKIVDGAKAIGGAVVDYAQDPFIPSKEAVGNFAYNATVGASESLGDMMFKGEGTQGDILSMATGMGAGGYAASTLNPVKGNGFTTGLFMNRNLAKGGEYDTLYDKALDMELQGIDRDTIWKETGWGKVFGEWMTETDDSITTTKGLQDSGATKTKYSMPTTKTDVITTENVVSKAVNAYKNKKQIQLKYKELVRIAKTKGLTPDELTAEITVLQQKMSDEILGASAPVTESTVKVLTSNQPANAPKLLPKVPNLTKKGNLDKVLGNAEEMLDLVPKGTPAGLYDKGQTTKMPFSEAGARQSTSANSSWSGYGGVHTTNYNKGTGKWEHTVRSFKNNDAKKGESPFYKQPDGSFGYARNQGDQDAIGNFVNNSDALAVKREEAFDLLDAKKDAEMKAITAEKDQLNTELKSMHSMEMEEVSKLNNSTPDGDGWIVAVMELEDKINSLDDATIKDKMLAVTKKYTPEYGKVSDKYDEGITALKIRGNEDHVWSTMLHETQHWIDGVFGSSSGKGANWKDSNRRDAIRDAAKVEYAEARNKIKQQYGTYNDVDAEMKLQPYQLDQYKAAKNELERGPIGRAMYPESKGGYSNLELYYRDGGETKSRMTQHRRNLTVEERRQIPPWVSLSQMKGYDKEYFKTKQGDYRGVDIDYPVSETDVWTSARYSDPEYDYQNSPLKNTGPNYWELPKVSPSPNNSSINSQMSDAFSSLSDTKD